MADSSPSLSFTSSITPPASPEVELGTVLVGGGCGFLGHHIVRALLDCKACSSVAVISRHPSKNIIPGAVYHACNVTSKNDLLPLLAKIRPHIIITTAAPLSTSTCIRDFQSTATETLLACAKSSPSVRHFIYCSSSSAIAGAPFSLLREADATLVPPHSRDNPYGAAKARDDSLVLASDDSRPTDGSQPFSTAVIRPSGIIGEGDVQVLASILAILENGQARFQLGSNSSHFDFVHVGNVADAHVLLAMAMVREATDPLNSPKAAGEAFFITNGQPMLFWDYLRLVWRFAGHPIAAEIVWVVPIGLVMMVAFLAEWITWALSFGSRIPEKFTRAKIGMCCLEQTFAIDKAERVLGYVPRVSLEEGTRRGVEWLIADRSKEKKIM
ncbi:erg26, C-3 sterol dehydrogenase [Xylographa carneopallida]|nr:erg26, C-3 sterol dehydrogenase [Xylographa carneopallida]